MKIVENIQNNISFIGELSNLMAMKLDTIRRLSRGTSIIRNELNNSITRLPSFSQISHHLSQIEKLLEDEKSR